MKPRSWSSFAAVTTLFVAVAAARSAPAAADDLPPLDELDVGPETLAHGFTIEVEGGVLATYAEDTPVGFADKIGVPGAFLGARWSTSLERSALGYSMDLSVRDTITTWTDRLLTSPGTSEPTKVTHNVLTATVRPEGRLYLDDRSVFAFVEAEVVANLLSVRGTRDVDGTTLPGWARIGGGLGAGRVRAIDPIIRLRRLERTLAARGALRAPISQDIGSDVIRTWYQLRSDLGSHRTLAYTMKRLAEAGLVTAPLGARSTRSAIAVLSDPYAVGRRAGWDARLGLAMDHDFYRFADDALYNSEEYWESSYSVVGSARIERPVAACGQLSVRLSGDYELGPRGSETRLDPLHGKDWAVRTSVAYARIFYGHDERGFASATLSADAGISGLGGGAASGVNDPRIVEAGARVELSRAISSRTTAVFSVDYGFERRSGGFTSGRYDVEHEIGISLGFRRVIATGYYTPYVVPAGL